MTELGQTCTMNELCFCLLGTKCDLGIDQANEETIQKWREKIQKNYGCELPYFQTSALKGQNIKEAAQRLATDILAKRRLRQTTSVERPVSLKLHSEQPEQKSKKGCSC